MSREPDGTYTARRTRPTPQLHSADTATCNHTVWLHTVTPQHTLSSWVWACCCVRVCPSPSFSNVAPDLEEVQVSAGTREPELYHLLTLHLQPYLYHLKALCNFHIIYYLLHLSLSVSLLHPHPLDLCLLILYLELFNFYIFCIVAYFFTCLFPL